MKRRIVLTLLLSLGALCLSVVGAQDSPKVIEVEQLEDNLFLLRGEGGGGNVAVFITTSGAVVVDSKNPGWGQAILDEIKTLTPNPVTTVINTHSHADHVSGNVAFSDMVEFVAHEVTKTNMEAMRTYTGRTEPPVNVFEDTNGLGLPTRTFTDRMSLGTGRDQIDLYYFGRAHTGGDAWVVFPALRTLHAGDAFLGKRVPFLDAANGGSGVDISDTLQKAYDTIQNVDTIITGHSTQATWEDLNEWAAFNRDFLEMVRVGRTAGKTVDEIASSWVKPSRYADYDSSNAGGVRRNIQVIVEELDRLNEGQR
jgi:glyoxylase-like metal-dependent hydrolase (beta-lactamase superfamily II)